MIDEDNFPTDRYIVASLAEQRGLEIRWIPEAGPQGVVARRAATRCSTTTSRSTVLSHVDYRSAAILDMAAMTTAAHDVGALTIWDLCHSVGVVPIDLRAGRRRPRGRLHVQVPQRRARARRPSPTSRRDLQSQLRQPIWGWFGRRDQFDMGMGYDPAPGIESWLTGTPAVLSMVGVEPSVALVAEAGIEAIRRKSELLTALAVDLYDQRLADLGWILAVAARSEPAADRMSPLSHPAARQVMGEVVAVGVIPDFRRPDGIRLGLAPLTTRFVDAFDGIERLASATPTAAQRAATL